MELWSYCKDVGQTPTQALADPDLPFNLSIMRADRAGRRMKRGLMRQAIGKDDFGIENILATLGLIYEDH